MTVKEQVSRTFRPESKSTTQSGRAPVVGARPVAPSAPALAVASGGGGGTGSSGARRGNEPAFRQGSKGVAAVVTEETIRAKAYELWRTRGGEPEFNWFEAERTLRDGGE